MSEETEGQDTGAEAIAGGIAGADPAGVALALTGADRSEANAYLREQRSLAADQRGLIAAQQHHPTRHVAVSDVVLIPPGTPHKFTQLDGQETYLVTRYNPGWYAKH
jgi:hypothetical protein